MTTVFVGVGSNIEPRRYVAQAITELEARFGRLRISTVYSCPAVGFDGDDFVNLVVSFQTAADLDVVQDELQAVEGACGRDRVARRGSRSMDLDLLLYGDTVIDTDALTLPRADILDYAFVLKPLAELAPDARHPVDGRTYADLWNAFAADDQPLTRIRIDGIDGDC